MNELNSIVPNNPLQPQMPDVSSRDLQVASCFEVAVNYLTKGYSVIPIGRDKKPLVSWKEFQNRLPTLEEVDGWYRQWPWAGVAIVTGRISKIVVFDIDPRNGGNPDKYKKYNTVKSKTGGGGDHVVFGHPDFDVPTIPNIYPGVDLKSEGSYIIVPPSLHPSGHRYVWEKNILDCLPSELPEELIKVIKEHGTEKTKFDPEILNGVSEGSRNESAASVVGKVIKGLPEIEWKTIGWNLIYAWNDKNKPPLSENELFSVFKSICSKERIRRITNSILPQESHGISVAETNISPPKIITWGEFLAQKNSESRDWLVKDFLRPGWLAVLGGHGKHGKSTLALHLVNALRTGGNFIYPCKKVPVTYINCEMHPDDVRDLIRSISGGNATDGNTSIVNQPPVPLDLNWVESLLSKDNPGVCVIDSFRGAFLLSGDTENNSGNVGASILRPLQNIARKTGWSIVIIHHFKKSGTNEPLDLAGSGEWTSAPDVIYTWSCPNFKEPGKLGILGRLPPSDELSIKVSRESIEFLGTVPENQILDERNKVKEALTDECQSCKEISKVVELPQSTVIKRLNELYEDKLVEKQGKGVKGNPFVWRLFDSNENGIKISEIFDAEEIPIPQVCNICGGSSFWTRWDGAQVCSTCHPNRETKQVTLEKG